MKKGILVLMSMFVAAFLVAQTNGVEIPQTDSTPFTTITLDPDGVGEVVCIDVYLNFNIDDSATAWAGVQNDFTVGGYTSAVTVSSIDTGDFVDDNIFRAYINASTPIPTDILSLLIRYDYDGVNQVITGDGYLWGFPWMNVEDGAAPSIITFTITSNHTNPILAVAGSEIDVTFGSNEELLDFPTVQLLVGTTELYVATAAEVVTTGDRYNWELLDIPLPALIWC